MSGGSARLPRFRAVMRISAAAVAAIALVVPLASLASAGAAEWNIARVGAPASSSDVVIAVVDTGVDANHPAFPGRVLPQLDFTGDGERGDPHGHGTHVAGTAIGGPLDCGDGPHSIGVAPSARVLPVRVFGADGKGSSRDVVAGIRAAADRGATVINLSLGEDLSFLAGASDDFRDAVNYAWDKGSIPVLAAGNDSALGSVFPDGYAGFDAVVVTATTSQDRKAVYASSVGSAKWGIAAPGGDGTGRVGEDIRSAYPGKRCARLAGTSMAAPHVSGGLAVLRSKGLGPAQAVERLLATAAPVGPEATYGAGLMDLAAAIGGSAKTPVTTAPSANPATTSGTPEPDPVATTSPSTEVAGSATSAPSSSDTAEPTDPSPGSTATTAGEVPSDPSTTTAVDSRATPLDAADTDEVAGPLGPDDDGDDRAGGGLVAAAVLACALAWAAALQVRRIITPP